MNTSLLHTNNSAPDVELIVFCDEYGIPTGETGPKLASHTSETRMHLAFSCYIFRDRDKKLLITERAHHKKVWPGVWTNSVCGHLSPGETAKDAVIRRAMYELGINKLENIKVALPDYTYKTPPYNDIIENEYCPIFTATTAQEPTINPSEVSRYRWVDLATYESMLKENSSYNISWWARDQFPKIHNVLYS